MWSVGAPLMQNLIIGVVFYYLMRFDMPNYIVYLFTGTVIFNVMSTVITQAPAIMLNNEGFIKKIYVPKLVYILQVVIFEIINFIFIILSLTILGIIFHRLPFSPYYLLIPLPVFLIALFLIGIAIMLSIVTLYFRDMLHIVPVAMQAVFFLTPVLYPESIIPAQLQRIIKLNPFYYFIEIFRSIVLYSRLPRIDHLAICTLLSVFLFIIGIQILQKFDNKIVFKL
jgi:ABC-type polysaccharide/polyol phosphate export permease